MPLKIATVPYCNAFPLIHCLTDHLQDATISECFPSQMREKLAEQTLDLALMPVAELVYLPKGKIISNCCIACNGEVRSVLLYSRKPIEQICSLALDTASRSSVMICEIILRQFYGIHPKKHRLEQQENPNDCQADAFVIIGDRALSYKPSDCWRYRYDLGELWKSKTGLPLVFAAWIGCSPKIEDFSLITALETSRDQGLMQLENILEAKERQGIALPLAREQILDYYRRAIVYILGEQEQAGLQLFFDLLLRIHPGIPVGSGK